MVSLRYNTSQFDHTSILATVKNLFNLTGFLTKRDAWAGSFDELLLDAPRADSDMCPRAVSRVYGGYS